MSDLATPSAERQSVSKICTALHHAYRGLRLYPADHPTAQQSMDTLVNSVTSYTETVGTLYLQIEEMSLHYEGEQVYSYQGSRDNLAFLMYRDGIRYVSFHPGIEPWEVEALVDCLSHADGLADLEHDLATVLWEREMLHIEYEVVDPFLVGGEDLRGAAVDDLRDTVIRRLSELTPGKEAVGDGAEGGSPGIAGPEEADDREPAQPDDNGLDAESTTLSPRDIELMEQVVADSADALPDFSIVLLEIVGAGLQTPTGDDVLARSLSWVVQQFVDLGDLDGLDTVLKRLRDLEAQGRRPSSFGTDVIGAAMTPARLAGLIKRMSGAAPEEIARIEQLLGDMRDWIYPVLLETLAEDNDKAVRKTVLALLHSGEGVPARYLWPLMRDPRWYVVRNAVQLATGSGDPDLAGQLERLLRHPDARVKREVIRSLDAMGGARSGALLAKALEDGDSGVRTLAVRSLRRHGSRANFGAVQAQVEQRDFESRSSEEIEAFLQTFAVFGGEAAVEPLSKMWKRRLFGTRPLPLRVAAAQALAFIPSQAAKDSLAEAARSGEVQVQRAAARALNEVEGRSGRPRT